MAAPFPRSDEVVRVVYPVPSEHLPGFGEDHGFTTIAIWNRKGGVGKTTMTHALGFGLALRGKRVLMVDASPQCDLSLLLLGMKWVRNRQRIADTRTGESDDDLSSHLKDGPRKRANTLREALSPVIEHAGGSSSTAAWAPADVAEIAFSSVSDGALFLLPGHDGALQYEQKVAIAYGTSLQAEAAAPGAWNKLIGLTARMCGADVVLIDSSPHGGMLNMHIILTSDYLLLPCTPDMYSHHVLDALPAILEGWVTMRDNARKSSAHAELPQDVQIPGGNPRVLGISVIRSDHARAQPSRNFQYWTNRIEARLREFSMKVHALPALAGVAGTPEDPNTWPSILTTMPDFCEFAALSHFSGLPVFALGPRFMCFWDAREGIARPLSGDQKDAMDRRVAMLQIVFKQFLQDLVAKIGNSSLVITFNDDGQNSGTKR